MKTAKKKNTIFYLFFSLVFSRLLLYIIFSVFSKTFQFNLFMDAVNQWDSNWYYDIAVNGYAMSPNADGHANWAFFPFFPLLIGILYNVTGIDVYVLAFIMSNLFMFFAMFIGYKYIILSNREKRCAEIYVYLMLFGLYNFYFSCFYTEAPFLFFLSCCFYFCKKRSYILMGISGAFLSFTRNMGVFFAIVFLVHWIIRYLDEYHKSFVDFVVTTLKVRA